MKKNVLLERLKTRKPPPKFQDICLKTFCAVRARLQPEDFHVEGLTRRQFAVRRGLHYESCFSFPLSQVFLQFFKRLRGLEIIVGFALDAFGHFHATLMFGWSGGSKLSGSDEKRMQANREQRTSRYLRRLRFELTMDT